MTEVGAGKQNCRIGVCHVPANISNSPLASKLGLLQQTATYSAPNCHLSESRQLWNKESKEITCALVVLKVDSEPAHWKQFSERRSADLAELGQWHYGAVLERKNHIIRLMVSIYALFFLLGTYILRNKDVRITGPSAEDIVETLVLSLKLLRRVIALL